MVPNNLGRDESPVKNGDAANSFANLSALELKLCLLEFPTALSRI